MERTYLNTFAASGTFFLVDHVNALCILCDRTFWTGLCALSALYADHRFCIALFVNDLDTGFVRVKLLVKAC